jgi:hypothetical protein
MVNHSTIITAEPNWAGAVIRRQPITSPSKSVERRPVNPSPRFGRRRPHRLALAKTNREVCRPNPTGAGTAGEFQQFGRQRLGEGGAERLMQSVPQPCIQGDIG